MSKEQINKRIKLERLPIFPDPVADLGYEGTQLTGVVFKNPIRILIGVGTPKQMNTTGQMLLVHPKDLVNLEDWA